MYLGWPVKSRRISPIPLPVSSLTYLRDAPRSSSGRARAPTPGRPSIGGSATSTTLRWNSCWFRWNIPRRVLASPAAPAPTVGSFVPSQRSFHALLSRTTTKSAFSICCGPHRVQTGSGLSRCHRSISVFGNPLWTNSSAKACAWAVHCCSCSSFQSTLLWAQLMKTLRSEVATTAYSSNPEPSLGVFSTDRSYCFAPDGSTAIGDRCARLTPAPIATSSRE